jgi:hypothetical protein
MQPKSRTKAGSDNWSLAGAKRLHEQERVRQMLSPAEQHAEKKKPGRPRKDATK